MASASPAEPPPGPRRLALVSDIHGNLPALEAVAAQIAAEQVDAVINLGDLLSGPLWPAETAAWLMTRGWPTLAGNHERQLLNDPPERMNASDRFARERLSAQALAWLAALPATLDPAPGVHAVHGQPASDLHYLLHTVVPGHAPGDARRPGLREATEAELAARCTGVHADVLLCGHSHLPAWRHHAGRLLVNPGSVGLPAFDDDAVHPHVVETGTPQARWALLWHDGLGWRARLRASDYDHAAAARRAEAAGRGDWADALLTGRVGRRGSPV